VCLKIEGDDEDEEVDEDDAEGVEEESHERDARLGNRRAEPQRRVADLASAGSPPI